MRSTASRATAFGSRYQPRMRTSTERACASRPSARASVVMAGASRSSAARLNCCTEITLTKSADGQAAAQPRRAAGGQHVIGAGGVIARGFGAERPDEDAAGVSRPASSRLRVGNAQVLGREAVGNLDRLLERAHQDDGAVARDGLARHRARWAASPAAARPPAPPRCARRFDVVSSTAEASTSCSACASMSAASQRGSPSSAMIRISVGPATKSMPTSPASSFLAAAT